MAIKCTTPQSEINAGLANALKEANDKVVQCLQHAGEAAVAEARSYNGKAYKDRTGNLRSSTGCVIARNGAVLKASTFTKAGRGTDGAAGGKQGLEYAKSLVRNFPHDLVLIVVAGMEYAAYVSAKGYNVLDTSEMKAREISTKLLSQLFKR